MPRHSTPLSSQRGAAAMVAAVWLVVAVACLMVLDLANIFWQKREVQKIADFAASAGASADLQAGHCPLQAKSSATQNGWREGVDTLTVTPVQWIPNGAFSGYADAGVHNNACAVEVTRPVPYLFVWSGPSSEVRTVRADAIAIQKGKTLARVFIRTTLASVNSTEPDAVLLNALVGGLLGGSLNLNAVGWAGLANANMTLLSFLDRLNTNLKLGVSYETLLNTELGIGDVLKAAAGVLSDNGTASAGVNALNTMGAGVNVPKLRVKLIDLLRINEADMAAALAAQINVLQLVQGSLQLSNSQQVGALDLALPLGGLGKVGVNLDLIEPPQWSIGEPVGLSASTAQVKLSVNVLGVGLRLELGRGHVVVTGYGCDSPESKYLLVNVISEGGSIHLTLDALAALLQPLPPISLLREQQNGIKIYPPQLKKLDEAPPSDLKASDWVKVSLRAGLISSILQTVKALIDTLLNTIPGLGALLSLVVGSVVDLLGTILSPVLDPVLNVLLKFLGVDLAVAEVAGQLSCGYGAELVH